MSPLDCQCHPVAVFLEGARPLSHCLSHTLHWATRQPHPVTCDTPHPHSIIPRLYLVSFWILRLSRCYAPPSNWRRRERVPVVVDHQAPYSHIQVVRNNDTPSSRARDGNNPENLFRYIPSENEVTSLRTTRPLDNTQSSAVASGQTFADIARSGAARASTSDPAGQRSSSGLMKMRPKQKSWKPLDLSDIDIYAGRSPLTGRSDTSTPIESDSARDDFPDSAISKTSPDSFSEITSRDTSLPRATVPEPRVQTMAYVETTTAVHHQQELDEIYETFGQRLPDPVWLRANEGKSSSQVKFIQHPSRDVTAHRWSAQNFEWQEIGRYSCTRKFIDGHVISPVFLQHIEADPSRPHSLKYFAKLASDYSGYVKSRPPSISSSTPSMYAPRPSLNFNPSLHDSARYDSLSSIASSQHGMELPSLANLSLNDRPAVMHAARPLQTDMHLQGLGASEDDPFTESVSPRNTRAYVPSPQVLRRAMNPGQQNSMMDFAFRFPPPGMLNRQRDESVYDVSDQDDMSVMSSDRRAYFADQERKRLEQMRQSVLNPNNGYSGHAQGFQGAEPQQNHGYHMAAASLYSHQANHEASYEPLTAVFAPQEYQPLPTLLRGGSNTDESRARMREYLNRTAEEVNHDNNYTTPADLVRSESSEPMSRPFTLAPPGLERPTSSVSQASRSALRTSDPDFSGAPSTAPVYDTFTKQGPTPQKFEGPFFEIVQPSTANPTLHRSVVRSPEQEMDDWWNSGSTTNYQRRKEYLDSLLAAGAIHGSQEGVHHLLIMAYEQLRTYTREPGTKQPFAPFGKPPDWCIDRSRVYSNTKSTFFGEDYGEVPKRIGRDPRFKPTPTFGAAFPVEPPSRGWPEEDSFSFNANPGGAAALGSRIGSSAQRIRY
ncbi:hypothetical protein HDK90DRAFT_556841 [Phyllosticta capitalensis]|uniref:Uncharacterized protein n=1 Tax=Phyllosticta capitalensis TaxID=121624 RepID=A0ABR1YJ67_9PEZI